MKYLILALTLTSCVPTVKQDLPTNEVISTKKGVDALLAIDPAKFPETPHWASEYDQIILETLKLYPVKKLPCDPLVTLKGIVKAESGFKKSSTYHESFGWDSVGLLQLSLEDEPWAKCGFKTLADVKNPIRNLYCGVKLMNYYENKHPTLNFYQAQGKYWAVVRREEFWTGKPQSGWKTVRAYWEANGCKVN